MKLYSFKLNFQKSGLLTVGALKTLVKYVDMFSIFVEAGLLHCVVYKIWS